ncbi:MAG: PorV/PorQ family protein [Candidatus Syntrophosphaera sp.]|nr:PorV/PorQ family protein [Candidatus Syntrophosphaera sp.]
MSKDKLVILAAVIAILSLPLALGAISQAGLLFLTFEPGARANGMGRAYTAVADDAFAPWWNPGATAFNRKTQIGGNHIPWLQGAGAGFDDMFYEYLGFNRYFDGIGNMNVHLLVADLGTQMQTDPNGIEIGEFHSFDFAGAFGYAYEVVPAKLGVGANFKLIYSYLGPGTGQTEDEGKAFGFAFDLGTKYKDLFIRGLDTSLVIQNIGPNVTYVDQAQSDPLPMTVRLGAAYQILDSPLNKFLISAEASKILANEDGLLTRFVSGWEHFDETIYGFGAEYTYLELISLRGGYFLDQAGEIVGPSFGAGIQYTFDKRYKLTADFAMITAGELTDYNKVFSVGFEF